jgi:O-antigen/teichoic acid export membrane protein
MIEKSAILNSLKGLLAPVWRIAAMEGIVYGATFLSLILKFRYLQLELVGLVGYFTALGDLPAAFHGHFNRALSRFLPECDERDRPRLLALCLATQSAISAVFILAFAACEFLFQSLAFWKGRIGEGTGLGFMPVYVILYVVATLLHRLILSFFGGIGRLQYAQKAEVIGSFLNIAVILIVPWLAGDRITGLKIILGSQIVIIGGITVVLWSSVSQNGGASPAAVLSCIRHWRSECAPIFSKYVGRYTVPLQAASVFAYVKENAAVILLGQLNYLESAGIYQLASKIFLVPRKFIPGLMDKLMPKMVAMAKRNKKEFSRRYNSFAWAQFAAYAITGTAILISIPLIKFVFHVHEEGVGAVFYLFSINLVISAIAQMNINIIMLGDDTRRFMVSSIVRSIVVVSATGLLIREYRMLGASLGLVISSVVVSLLLSWETRRSDLFNWSLNWKQAICLFLLGACWLLPLRMFQRTYL